MPDPAARRHRARASAGQRLAPLRIDVTDELGRPLAARRLASWLRRVAPARARGALNVALVSDARIRTLNRRYRGKNYATDVLSFANPSSPIPTTPRAPTSPGSPIPTKPRFPVPNPRFLGDIVIARGVARRQARAAGHDELTELRILALHGLLHLLGYDHERDDGLMLRAERRLRRKGGLREGLIERARPGVRRGTAGSGTR